MDIKIADPAALGLVGFGMTTCILSLVNMGIIGGSGLGVVLALAVAYGGGAQLVAGLWEFRKGNTFGATAFFSYGCFWISFYVLQMFTAKASGVTSTDAGWYLFFWGVFTFYMWFGTFYLNKALFFVFLFLCATFILLAIADWTSSFSANIGGTVGLVTGLVAMYTSAAVVLNSTAGRTILPVGSAFVASANS